jgi:general secretion pathway protein A
MNRPRSKSFYFTRAPLPRQNEWRREPAQAFRHQSIPNQPSVLLARNGFNFNSPKKEKDMEREPFNNRLAVPLNFLAMNISSGIPMESMPFIQDETSAIGPIEVPGHAQPPEIIEENIPSKVSEGSELHIQTLDNDGGAPVETEIAANLSTLDTPERQLQMFTMNSDSERVGREFETPALWSWESEVPAAIIPEVVNYVEHAPDMASATVHLAPEVVEPLSAQVLAAAEIIEQEKYRDVAELDAAGESGAAPEKSIMLPAAAAEKITAPPTLLSFHGLRQQPFDVTPDPSYLYFSASHREALTSISEGVENFRGFMALIAEPGMGKTTLLNKLMEELSATARVVFLFQTQCTSSELLAFFLNELEVDHTGMDVVAMHRALNQVLLEEMLRGRRFVLIVDEAQNLQDSVLETIRLLSDFETAHSKLIQIVLAGQPQLADTLLRPSLVQLRQRIAILSSLQALGDVETTEYIEHRLRAAGWSGQLIFTPEALELIAELSGGVPRTINNLCFNALHRAFKRRQEIIDSGIVKEVSGKLHLEGIARRSEKITALPVSAPSPAEHYERNGAAELAQAISEAIAAAVRPTPEPESAAKPQAKPGVIVTGKLIEKINAQSWSKKHEYRIDVSFERDPITGIPVADRHYCCNFYIGEEEAASLQVGKPIRIRIEQE